MGIMVYAFYAMQPYLLELYGDPTAYGIAGLAAAIVAGAQIVGGLSVPLVRKLFRYRTQAIATLTVLSVAALVFIGLTSNLAVAISFLVVWGLMYAAALPMRQAYLNGLIHSDARATVLSFDSSWVQQAASFRNRFSVVPPMCGVIRRHMLSPPGSSCSPCRFSCLHDVRTPYRTRSQMVRL